MGILDRLLGSASNRTDYSDRIELKAIWDSYMAQWPENNERYSRWKPASVLPAPKWAIKRAIKLCYAEWPEPIEWAVFQPFFMEFVDLAMHLPQKKYDVVEKFRGRRVMSCGKEDTHDPLLRFYLSSSLATFQQIEYSNRDIVRIRDGVRRSAMWDPVDADDSEIDAVRGILLESATEFASLIEEWRFYILSIGRDQYVKTS